MKYARFFLLLVIGFIFTLPLRTSAQNSPYTQPKGNVGTWSWDKSQPKPAEEDEEEREPGETSWERMQSGRQPAEAAPPQEEILKSLSPLSLWRWWRGEKSAKVAETQEATDTPAPEGADSETSDESEEE
jgi:hypothetical protein